MENPSRTLSRSQGRVRSDDGTLIAYERLGDGPPVVLVGGALSAGSAEAPLAALLAPRFTVVSYDRRGRGGSGDTAPYAVEREVADLAAVVAEAGGPVSVHGTASGGVLALRAVAMGVPVAQLSVYEPPLGVCEEVGRAFTAHRDRLRELLARGARGDAVELFLGDSVAQEALAGLRGTRAWPRLEALAHTLAYDDEVLGDGRVPLACLERVRARVMVVDGGASPAWLRDAARAVAAALPRGRHRTLTGQTHTVAPHVLAPLLEEFFAD
ncbi:alpha/beta fold hydrolase [Streptomyces sp. NPDC001941]|uniref:alpha/beta fold hydrolase n=1 Tax=Streptomyces sp. NPDC001941 TaxID=3154659 RepID=UPI003328E5DD